MTIRFISAALALTLWAASLFGQTTFFEQIAPALSREDYQLVCSRLSLTKEQRAAADELYEGYLAEHRRNAAEYKQTFKDIEKAKKEAGGEDAVDPADNQRFMDGIMKYERAKPGAQQTFLKDVRAMLEAKQEVDWEPVERFVRRQMMNRLATYGVIEWQRPDLIRGVFLLKLSPEVIVKVQRLLDEYELLVDKPLRRMEPVRGAEGEDARRVWMEGVLELRSINRRFLRLIAQELPAESGAQLTAWARNLAYWHMEHWDGRIIREGASEARKLPTFTREQGSRIDSLILEMEKATATLRREAERAYDEVDEKLQGKSQREMEEVMMREDNPLITLSGKWSGPYSELWLGWIAQLEQILTLEQRRELWPPDGKLLDASMEKAKKVWE